MVETEKEIAELKDKIEKVECEIANLKDKLENSKNIDWKSLILPVFALIVSIIALNASIPNYGFGLSIGDAADKVYSGDVITKTIQVTDNRPIAWLGIARTWLGINNYPFPVTLTVNNESKDILAAFIPDTGQKVGNNISFSIGIKPGSTMGRYKLEIEGVGSDGTKRTCTYYLIVQGREINNKTSAEKWGKVGSDLLQDNYRCFNALPWFDIALKLDTDNSIYLEGKADCLDSLMDYNGSINASIRSLHNLERYENGRYKDNWTAAEDYCIWGDALKNLGYLAMSKGDHSNASIKYNEAIKCFDTATNLEKYYFQPHFHKGETYSFMENCSGASDSFIKAKEAAVNETEVSKREIAKANNREERDRANKHLKEANDHFASANDAFSKTKELGCKG